MRVSLAVGCLWAAQLAAQSYGGSQNAIRIRGTIVKTCSTNGGVLTYVSANSDWECLPGLSVQTSGQGYLMPFGNGSFTPGPVTVANQTRFWQFTTSGNITVKTISIFIVTPIAASNMRAAIYAAPCSGAASVLAQTTSVPTSSAVAIFMALSAPLALTPGVYWLALTDDTAGVQWEEQASTFPFVLNEASYPRVGTGNASTGSAGTLAMPSSCGTITAGILYPPGIGFLP